MNLFTKDEAKLIREKYSNLIGTKLDEELKITNIWVIPNDQDLTFIINLYQNQQATSASVAETYGKGRNLKIVVASSDLLNVSPLLPMQDISMYIPTSELSEILQD